MHMLSEKRIRQLDEVDAMPGDLRACVHEFGLPIVTTLCKFGIRDPRHIREVVREIWLGARQAGQKRGVIDTVDILLSGGPMSVKTLRRLLFDNNHVIVPMSPTRAMMDASLEEVSGHNVRCTKEQKHFLRLRAALMAEAKRQIAKDEGEA